MDESQIPSLSDLINQWKSTHGGDSLAKFIYDSMSIKLRSQQRKNCIHCGGSGYIHMGEGEYSECPCIVDNQEIIHHLKWIYDRMVHHFDQDPRIDYMIKFKSIIDQL